MSTDGFVPDPNPEQVVSGGNDTGVTAQRGEGVPSEMRDIRHDPVPTEGSLSTPDRTLIRMSQVRHGLGILGGTFDPPHIGHLAAAVEVRSALHLERVLLMVANEPWQKVGNRPLSAPQDRFDLTSASVGDLEGIEASSLEIDRGGPTYSIDTLHQLKEIAPDQQLFLIVGSDAALNLHTWHRHEELPGLATLVIVERDGDRDAAPPAGWSVERVSMPRLEISSSDMRERVRDGRPLNPFVVPDVINEINARGLYGFTDS